MVKETSPGALLVGATVSLFLEAHKSIIINLQLTFLCGKTGEYLILYLGLVRSPHVQRFDRVADGHVPVHAHHRQGEGAGEHVIVVDGHHCLAQSFPEWPEAQEHVCALETHPEIKD